MCLSCLLFCATAAFAETTDEEALSAAYGGEELISLATGAPQKRSQAPAAATVITAEDIVRMGATDLDQVLEGIPGLHVTNSTFAYNSIYLIRGIYSQYNPQVLVLINGIPITSLYQGDRGVAWGGMPVNNIARIEVIRGPGSALYGADAFAGTINIVTKTADDIGGTQIGGRVGSFDTKDAWLLHGSRWGGVDAAFALELHHTDGQKRIVEADYQTQLDGVFSSSASRAPGPVNRHADTLDTRLDLSKGDWRLRLGYQGRRDLGLGAGVAEALDPQGHLDSDRYNADLGYHNAEWSENWDVAGQISAFNSAQIARYVIFPPGAFGGAYPDGMIGNPEVYERHLRASLTGLYTGLRSHRIRLGGGHYYGDLYKARESKNFDSAFAPLTTGVTDVSDSAPFIRPHTRRVFYALVQDEWNFAPDWVLTAGARYDRYSDFGDTTNPRLALVWQTRHNLTSKLLYGRAFRAPSFAELYNINNPVLLGNPNAKPETIDTLELAFDYRPSDAVQTSLSVFGYAMHDILRYVADPPPAGSSTAQNSGSQRGYGLEWEASWQAREDWRLTGNYAFQRSRDVSTGSDAGHAPHHHVYLRSDWQLQPDWRLSTQANWVAERKRIATDTRPAVQNYATVDLTLRRENLAGHWNLAASIHNLFNADAREPSPAPGKIPNDLPLPGRSLFIEISYNLL